jgi:hypothetical protein
MVRNEKMNLAQKKGHQTNRIEAFSDAVFALSATLLVVSLEVPGSFSELTEELQGFAAFALSFGALVLIWSVHNSFFRRYGLEDRVTILLNSCLLFVILFYVYPLRYVAEGFVGSLLGLGNYTIRLKTLDELAQLFMLYSGGFVAIFFCFSLLYLHAYRSRNQLSLEPGPAHDARFYHRHYLIFVAVGLLSILLAWLRLGITIGLPGFIYGLLGPLCYGHAAWSRRRLAQPFR